jgi:protein SCO1
MKRAFALLLLAAAFFAAGPARGQASLPRAARAADLEERLGERVPGELRFTDTSGSPARLRDYLADGKPVVLSLFYYRCPMICSALLAGVVEGLGRLSLRLGQDYRALTVSFDPRDRPDEARRKQESVLAGLGRPDAAASWPFLVGERAESAALADAIGFRFAYDEATDQYAHPATLVVLTPDGRISRYLYGLTFAARDLRLALLEAGEGNTGTIADRVILTCYRYDPATRRYGPFILGFMRLGAAAILLGVGLVLGVAWRGERRRAARGEDDT